MACASKLQAASGLANTNSPLDIFDNNWESPRRAPEPTQAYADRSIEMCVVSISSKMLSILVTIRRSAMTHPHIGMVQMSILLVEGHVPPYCDLPTIYPIPIILLFPSHTLQIVL